MLQTAETTVCAVSEGVACGETLFDTRAERFNERVAGNSYTGFLLRYYSRPNRSVCVYRGHRCVQYRPVRVPHTTGAQFA